MVVSRAADNYKTSTITEVLSSGSRVMSNRVSELPSLSFRERFGFGPASNTQSTTSGGPLRVTIHLGTTSDKTPLPPPRRLSTRYARSFTDDLSATTAAERRVGERRVRFELPPKSPSLASGATILSNGNVTKPPATHVAGVDSWLRSRTGVPELSSSGTTTSKSVTRVHDTGRYRKGTLPPTSNSMPPEVLNTPGAGAVLKAARDADEKALNEYLRLVTPGSIAEEDVNAVDGGGRTAVSYIAAHGTQSMLEAIFQLPGVDVNKPDNEGNTPLHFAAQAGHAEVVNFILSRCSEVHVDARNHLGFTPLMKAALQGRSRCAKLLIVAGASTALKDTGKGLRPDEWARYCGRYVCADMIVKLSRHHLLERTASCGRWGSEPDLVSQLLEGTRLPPATQPNQSHGFKTKFKHAFWTKSHNNLPAEPTRPRYSSLVSQLTSAALCASSPVLPTRGTTTNPSVKSLIRPLAVPKLQITPVASGAVGTVATTPATTESTGRDRQATTRSSGARQIFLKKKK